MGRHGALISNTDFVCLILFTLKIQQGVRHSFLVFFSDIIISLTRNDVTHNIWILCTIVFACIFYKSCKRSLCRFLLFIYCRRSIVVEALMKLFPFFFFGSDFLTCGYRKYKTLNLWRLWSQKAKFYSALLIFRQIT